jgi:hypothetical protein
MRIGDPLGLQKEHCVPPTVALLADAIADRHTNVVKFDAIQMMDSVNRNNRMQRDPG